MDNRFRFLHPYLTELWGHGEEVWPGDGIPGASAEGAKEENPFGKSEGVTRSESQVAKHMEEPSRKAAIVQIRPVP